MDAEDGMQRLDRDQAKRYLLDGIQAALPGLRYGGWLDADTVDATIGGSQVQLYLGNKLKEYAERGDVAVLDEYVSSVARIPKPPRPPEEIRQRLLVMLEPADLQAEGVIALPFSHETKALAMYFDDDGFHFVHERDRERLGLSAEELLALGRAGIDQEIAGATLQETRTDWGSYFWFDTPRPSLKASFLLGNTLLGSIQKVVPNPVVFASNRDCLYVTDAANEVLIQKIAGVCLEDYQKAGYPVTCEVFAVRDGRLVAIGTYAPPTDRQQANTQA